MDPNQTPSNTGSGIPKSSIPTGIARKPAVTATSGIPSRTPTATASTIPTPQIKKPTTTSVTQPPSTTTKIASDEKSAPASALQKPSSLVPPKIRKNEPSKSPPSKTPAPSTTATSQPVPQAIPSSSNGSSTANVAASGDTSEATIPKHNNGSSNGNGSNGASSDEKDAQIGKLNDKVKDLEEKLATIRMKKKEDQEKIEKYKIQVQHLQEFKIKAQEQISELNREVTQAHQDTKSIKEQFEAYKEAMSDHEQRVEEMTVDKELAEARAEEMQDELNKANDKVEELKLELEVLKGEIELNGVQGASESFQVKQQEEEIKRLKAALLKMHDLSLQDKNKMNEMKKNMDDVDYSLKAALKEAESLRNENSVYVNQINDLKDQLTANLGAEQMIENLSAKVLDYEERIAKLSDENAELEEMNDINDQLIQGSKEAEKDLREKLDLTETKMREYERAIETLKYSIADHEKTIVKFREVVKQLQSENDIVNRKLQAKIEEQKSAALNNQAVTNYDFKQKFIETKNYAKIIENELYKIEINSLKKYINYIICFLSDQFSKRSGDHECVQTLLFFNRVTNKVEMVLKEIREKNAEVCTEDQLKSNFSERVLFVNEISIILSYLKLLFDRFDHILNTCDLKTYNHIGSMYFDLQVHEKAIDGLIELLQKDQLDESINLDIVEKICTHLLNIHKNHLANEGIDGLFFLSDLIKYGIHNCDSIYTDLQRLLANTHLKDDTSEIMILLREVNSNNEELKVLLKKALRNLPKCDDSVAEKDKAILAFPSDVKKQLENCMEHFYKLSKTLREILTLFQLSSPYNGNGKASDAIVSKKLEDCAFQACDRVYLTQDNGPYENLRNSMSELCQTFKTIAANLETGEYEQSVDKDKPKPTPPVFIASEKFKNVLIEAETLKYKIEAKEDEIKEMRKQLKFKSEESSEQKVRVGLAEKKVEVLQKESEEKINKLQQSIEELRANSFKTEKDHKDALDALQQELSMAETEKRELKDKLRSYTRKTLGENLLTSRQVSEVSTSSAEPLSKSNINVNDATVTSLIHEINLLKSMNKLLQNQYDELLQKQTSSLLDSLVPIPDFQAEDKKRNQIRNLYSESQNLMKECYMTMASIKVPEVTFKENKENDPLAHFNLQVKNDMQHIKYSTNKLQEKFRQLRAELAPAGTHVETELKSFPTSDYAAKISGEQERLIAEILVPCAKGQGKVVELHHLTGEQIKDILHKAIF